MDLGQGDLWLFDEERHELYRPTMVLLKDVNTLAILGFEIHKRGAKCMHDDRNDWPRTLLKANPGVEPDFLTRLVVTYG